MTMKLNKNKGKVHPSPSSSSSSSSSSFSQVVDPVSSLNSLLPAAILTLISVLSLQDREVLAYMITRSLKSPLTLEIPNTKSPNKPKKTKPKKSNSNHNHNHKSPSFDCECFECYTTYWFRWDNSPHRELIHQAIEAFEDHLENNPNKPSKHSRRREKTPIVVAEPQNVLEVVSPENENEKVLEEVGSPENVAGEDSTTVERENEVVVVEEKEQKLQREEHKGLARKVLPDVIGLFNSRLWNLWGPNV